MRRGKLLVGDAPDPGGAVADDDPAGRGVEAAPLRLAIGTLGEGGRQRVGVAAGRALDRGVVADRPAVAHGPARLVAPFGRPQGGQLDLAGLGRTVRLLAAAAFDLGGAHRHTGAVQPQVHGRRGAGDGFGHIAFVGGDLTSQGFGGALDLLGLDAHRGQFPQQVAGRGEAEVGRRQPHHPQHAGRQRRGVQAQRPVARTNARATGVAVVVGAFQCQRPQHRGERLGAPSGVARRLSAGARCRRTRMVGMVLVQSPCHRRGGDSEGLATECLLEGLEILRVGPPRPDERIDFSLDRGYERCAPTAWTTRVAVASARR